jgi:hypothetical protein
LPVLEARRTEIRAHATALLERRKAAGVEELTGADAVKMRAMLADLGDVEYDIREIRSDAERSGVPEKFQNLGRGRHVHPKAASMMAPLSFVRSRPCSCVPTVSPWPRAGASELRL